MTTFSLGTFSHDGGERFAAMCIGDRVLALHALHAAGGGLRGRMV